MTHKHIDISITHHSATILLNRPEVRNALNPLMIAELIAALKSVQADPEVKLIVIRGKNGTFCSGADLNWLRNSGSKSLEENLAESRMISELMGTLHQVPVPLISLAEGSVFGGGLGILGCSDWVLAEEKTSFCFSEVRLGLAPAIIMPYILSRSSNIKIRQLMLTGQIFDAWMALDTGLTDQVGSSDEMEAELQNLRETVTSLPTAAVREIKRLWHLAIPSVDQKVTESTIQSLAALKQTREAQELLTRFLHKK